MLVSPRSSQMGLEHQRPSLDLPKAEAQEENVEAPSQNTLAEPDIQEQQLSELYEAYQEANNRYVAKRDCNCYEVDDNIYNFTPEIWPEDPKISDRYLPLNTDLVEPEHALRLKNLGIAFDKNSSLETPISSSVVLPTNWKLIQTPDLFVGLVYWIADNEGDPRVQVFIARETGCPTFEFYSKGEGQAERFASQAMLKIREEIKNLESKKNEALEIFKKLMKEVCSSNWSEHFPYCLRYYQAKKNWFGDGLTYQGFFPTEAIAAIAQKYIVESSGASNIKNQKHYSSPINPLIIKLDLKGLQEAYKKTWFWEEPLTIH